MQVQSLETLKLVRLYNHMSSKIRKGYKHCCIIYTVISNYDDTHIYIYMYLCAANKKFAKIN